MSRAEEDNLAGSGYRQLQKSGTISFQLTQAFDMRLGYTLQADSDIFAGTTLSNSMFGLSFTAKF